MNRLTFLKKHLIFLKSLKEPLGGNCVKMFDCRAFSLFETVHSCWAFSQCVVFLFPKTRSHKYAPMDSVFCSHKEMQKNTYHHGSETINYVWLWRKCTCFCFCFLRFTWLELTWTYVTSRHVTLDLVSTSRVYFTSPWKRPKQTS